MKPVLISCGSKKLTTAEPVMAWQLYQGGYFKIMLDLATKLSDRVYILSALYGFLNLTDMVLPYEKKMDKKQAELFKKEFVLQEPCFSLLGTLYESACDKAMLQPVIVGATGMGIKMSLAKQMAKGKPTILDLSSLTPGAIRYPYEQSKP